MEKSQRIMLVLLRLGFGWLFLYAGATKVLNPAWSAAGYLKSAHTFTGLYEWLASPAILPLTNILNEWGQVLIGLALIIGIGVPVAAFAGALMMLLYYFPILQFPYPNAHSFLVDEHIIYILGLLLLAAFRAGSVWGLASSAWVRGMAARHPNLAKYIG
jgi:thiosulfate dehydrogenase [quinone] large subunit